MALSIPVVSSQNMVFASTNAPTIDGPCPVHGTHEFLSQGMANVFDQQGNRIATLYRVFKSIINVKSENKLLGDRIMRISRKILPYLFLILSVVGIMFLSIELLYPRDCTVSVSLDGVTIPWKLEKFEENNRYYISFKEQQKGNKEIRLVCTKEQYDFITKGEGYHIIYRKNFFNRRTGIILKLDDKPIYDGNIPIAIYDNHVTV